MSREFLVRKATTIVTTLIASVIILTSFALAQEKPNPKPIVEQLKIVVLGDSLSAGYGLAPGESFPEKLQKKITANNYNIVIKNAGVSGDTTSGGLARLNWSVPKDTNGVIVELGANDALRGISPTLTQKNLAQIVSQLKARNIKVMLTGMLAPPNMGKQYGQEFSSIYPKLAIEEDLILYPFFLDGVAGNPNLNQADAMHPTSKGIDIIVDNIMPTMKEFIDTLQK